MGLLSKWRPRTAADSPADEVRAVSPPAGASPHIARDAPSTDPAAIAERLASAGRRGEALRLLRTALAVRPGDGELLQALGSTYFGWGRYREACVAFAEAERAGLRRGDFFVKCGWAHFWAGAVEDAERWMRKAADLDPADWAPQFGLGMVLHALQRHGESRIAYERALTGRPDDVHCLVNLSATEIALGQLADAEAHARRAAELDAASPVAWTNLGVVLDRQQCFAEALAAFERAEELEKATAAPPEAFANHAICLYRTGRVGAALELLESRLRDFPSRGPHGYYALTLLTQGRLIEGWTQFEFRWLDDALRFLRPGFIKPHWDGQDLRGRTILLRSEQGLGDFVQFIRYAAHVKALGATVLLELREEMRGLAKGLAGIDRILEANQPYPAFDFYANLLSLPRVFGTDLDTIPADIPYIAADPVRVERWRTRLGADGSFLVGLVWAGSPTHQRDRFRSIALASLAPLGEVEGVRFYSLQKGAASAAVVDAPEVLKLVDLSPEIFDFCDTAAIISELDLVICVDTSVAHLAGALGKPVWVLLPVPADWRWLEGREDSPWYPTMRLFRQSVQGDWSSAIDAVKVALLDAVRSAGDNHAKDPLPVAAPTRWLSPSARSRPDRLRQFTAVAETRFGLFQYFPSDRNIGRSLETYGEYLQRELDLMAPMVRPGSVVVEVGADVGVHAVFLARAIGPQGHLLLYEADDTKEQVLQQNLLVNGIGNCTLMRRVLGASESPGSVDNARAGAAPTASAMAPRGDATESLDDLQLDRLDWLKLSDGVDAESVLEGAGESLWGLRPNVLVAAATDALVGRVAARLRGYGYRTWLLRTPLFNPANFSLRESDIFSGDKHLAVFALAEEKDSVPGDGFELTDATPLDLH